MSATPAGSDSLLAWLGSRPPGAFGEPALCEASGAPVSRSTLVARARAVSCGLRSAGMAPGDRVLFCVRPGIAAVVLMLALDEAGGVIVPLDPRMGAELFESRVAALSPRWVIAESLLLAASSRGVLGRLLRLFRVRLAPLARTPGVTFVRVGLRLPGIPDALPFEVLGRADTGLALARTPRDPGAPALVVFTSGTTQAPKAVVHTHRSVAETLAGIGGGLGFESGGTVYSQELHLILPALAQGARVVIPAPGAFSAERTCRSLDRHGITHAFMVPSECRALIDFCRAGGRQLPGALKVMLLGAAPVRAALLLRLRDILVPATRVVCIYGMTEMLTVARISIDEKLAYRGTGDLVGQTMPGVEASVAASGELVVRGAGLFSGYYGAPPSREHRTGDLARIEDGRIILLGRRKEMIIRGRHNVYPELYEPAIEQIPGVRRCALVGLYDEDASDERIALVVEPDRGVDGKTLVRHVRLELKTGPRRIEDAVRPDFVLAMSLPECGRSSKVDKTALGSKVRARLGWK